MNPILLIALLELLTFIPLSIAETIFRHDKAEEIASLDSIAMLFDGGSIRFRFVLSSGSNLDLILNDQKQMDGVLTGIPGHSSGDWWLWLDNDRMRSFLDPDKEKNQEIMDTLTNFIERHSDSDDLPRMQLMELLVILKDRGREKVSYNFWAGYKAAATK